MNQRTRKSANAGRSFAVVLVISLILGGLWNLATGTAFWSLGALALGSLFIVGGFGLFGWIIVNGMAAEDDKLSGKVALVTGAASGIGEATAKLCAVEGATVIVSDVRLDSAETGSVAIRETGRKAEAVALDVTDEATWQSVMAGIAERHGRLDVLVNSAGISVSKPIVEMTLDEWQKVMAVNLDGVFLGTKHAIAAMKNGGSIVNVASVSGITPSAGASNYCASKAAVRIFSKTAAIECADAKNGIRVNVVTPGGVKTPIWEREDFFKAMIAKHGCTEEAYAAMAGDTQSHQFFSPEEVAQTILYLASDESSHLTGTEIVLDRGHTG